MSTTKIIPLQDQPAYKEAISKAVNIGRALAATDDRLEAAEAALRIIQNSTAESSNALDRAIAIANGIPTPGTVIAETALAEIQRLQGERKALKDGLVAANKAAEAVAEQLAREMGAKAKAKHVAAVAQILECVEALAEANDREQEIRLDLERLGYHRHGVQPLHLNTPGRTDDWTGSPAYYFAQEAKQYIGK